MNRRRVIRESLKVLALLIALTAGSARAARLEGRLVNGSTGGPGSAERVELVDISQGMVPMASLEDVEGSFAFEDVPEQSAAHFLLRVTSDGVTYTQSVQADQTAEPIEIRVYASTTDRSSIRISIHRVIFQRHDDHMQVTELLEFTNESDPPRAIQADSGPLRLHLPHDIHGEIETSIGAGSMPLKLPLLETDETDVYRLDYPLRPGSTRLVVRYLLGYETSSARWAAKAVYSTGDRRALISPPDVSVQAPQMVISDDAGADGFQVYAGLGLEPGDAWEITLAGGSAQAVDPHAGMASAPGSGDPVESVRVQPHRFESSRGWIMAGLALLLVGALAYTASSHPAASSTLDRDPQRERLSRLADRFVSGEIDSAAFERERDHILGKKSPSTRTPAGSAT